MRQIVLLCIIFLMIRNGITDELTWEGNATIIAADADDRDINPEINASVDLNFKLPTQRGAWWFYLEANSDQQEDAVSVLIPESNADAGTAVQGNGDSRIQVSELYYQFLFHQKHTLSLGFLDVTAEFDTSEIANDENTQFIAPSLVNNPTVEYPDYSIGMVYQLPSQGVRPTLRAALLSADGLADNASRDYSEFFNALRRNNGVFAAVEAHWQRVGAGKGQRDIKLGLWANTSQHQPLSNNSRQNLDNYGIYASWEQQFDMHALLMRAGTAREAVSESAGFIGMAYQYDLKSSTFGLGWTRAFVSDQINDVNAGDTNVAEVYWRIGILESISISPYFQGVYNSDYNRTQDFSIAGIRLNAVF